MSDRYVVAIDLPDTNLLGRAMFVRDVLRRLAAWSYDDRCPFVGSAKDHKGATVGTASIVEISDEDPSGLSDD